ncbi:MAG: TlpA disulfide reductase family protein, partial [Lautropia sp.]
MSHPRLRRRAVLGVAALAGLAGAGLSWWRWQELQQAERATGEAVTLFYQQILPDSEGRVFKFDQLRNQQVVVNFWATWCAPCIEEMPELSALATELQS